MWAPEGKQNKILILGGLIALTVAIHYGWVFDPIFGHVHWIHSLHGRFCYIPIVVAAAWFGLRGGLLSAAVISTLVLPYIFRSEPGTQAFAGELVEIVFYFAIGLLIGALVDREYFARRKQQEAQLQVERSQKLSLAGQIAAGVAHEIKNPLASIKGAADILSDSSTTDDNKSEFTGIMHDEIRRIDATVTEFLAFARPRDTLLEKLDLSEVLQSCVKQISTQAGQSGIRVVSDIEENVIVDGDGEKLHQMALNLILNAMQASATGTTVIVNLDMNGSVNARLEVSDSGEGIPPGDLEHIFEPFYTTKTTGSGLGLAIVKSIVDNHKGEISIRNNADRGITATVTLPLKEA